MAIFFNIKRGGQKNKEILFFFKKIRGGFKDRGESWTKGDEKQEN
jgi:hypothetical protein